MASISPLRRSVRLASAWFGSEERWLAWGLAAATLALTLGQIAVALRVNLWHRQFFDALAARDAAAMGAQGWLFLGLVVASMACAVGALWARQMLALRWRRWLVQDLHARWLAQDRHCHMAHLPGAADNPDQRISENTRWATAMAVDLATGLLGAVLNLVSFAGVLWALSAGVPLLGVALPGGMVWLALAYAAAGAGLTWLLGHRLTGLHLARNTVEGDHRFALLRVRENAEAVAMAGGGADEARGLDAAFGRVMGVMLELLRRERHLMWLGSGYGMLAAVLPLLVAGPRYLAGTLTLGALVQLGQAFAEVVKALSWWQENWPRLADWRGQVERVVALEESLAAAEALAAAAPLARVTAGEALVLEDVTLRSPGGAVLLQGAAATVRAGERVLLQGANGSGKSTLFRALAGLWPWAEGRITLPAAPLMLVPQRPYLPLGSLRAVLSYPAEAGRFADGALVAALARCGLAGLAGRLDEDARWDRTLSLGEQQRLGFARLLLHAPQWALLDEATSALDEAAEASLLALFEAELSGTTLVSIGHRPGLAAWHDRVLRLEGGRLTAALPPLPARGRARVAHAHAVPAARPRGGGPLRAEAAAEPG